MLPCFLFPTGRKYYKSTNQENQETKYTFTNVKYWSQNLCFSIHTQYWLTNSKLTIKHMRFRKLNTFVCLWWQFFLEEMQKSSLHSSAVFKMIQIEVKITFFIFTSIKRELKLLTKIMYTPVTNPSQWCYCNEYCLIVKFL